MTQLDDSARQAVLRQIAGRLAQARLTQLDAERRRDNATWLAMEGVAQWLRRAYACERDDPTPRDPVPA